MFGRVSEGLQPNGNHPVCQKLILTGQQFCLRHNAGTSPILEFPKHHPESPPPSAESVPSPILGGNLSGRFCRPSDVGPWYPKEGGCPNSTQHRPTEGGVGHEPVHPGRPPSYPSPGWAAARRRCPGTAPSPSGCRRPLAAAEDLPPAATRRGAGEGRPCGPLRGGGPGKGRLESG